MKKDLLNALHPFFWVLSLLFSTATTAQTVQTFNSSGSWTCPAGITSVFVETWGAGGAGGGIVSSATGAGGGGAGGSYSGAVVTVVPGTSYPYVVGTGGVGAKSSGQAGGSSSFNGGVIAPGGAGGGVGPSGAGGIGTIGIDFDGGDGFAGTTGVRSGAGGGGAGSVQDGGDATSAAAGAGGTLGGGAGGAGRTTTGAGNSGTGVSGGGGGAYAAIVTGFNGGNGANGQVKLTYLSCGSVATNTALVTTTSMNWSTAASWSLGHAPTACENAVIIVDRSVAVSDETVTITIPAFSVKSLTIRNISSSGYQVLVAANVPTLSTVTIFGDLTIETYRGAAGTGCPNNRTAFGGTSVAYNIFGNMILGRPNTVSDAATEGHATVQGNPSIWNLGGDLTFNPKGYNTNRGTNYKMNAGGTHYMINNTNPPVFNDTIKGNRFETLNLGNANPTTIILGGTNDDFSISSLIAGDLNIGVNSTLDIPANYSFNMVSLAATTSNFRLAAGAKLRVGGDQSLVTADGSNMGVAGSNFPGGYDFYTLHPTSTVEYYGSNAITQTLFNGVTYGNLLALNGSGSGRANKQTTAGTLSVATSFNINALTDVYLGTAAGLGSSTSPVTCNGPLNIAATGGLYCNANVVSGTGAFTMGNASFLGMGHAQGISPSGSATGNIQMTGGRTYVTPGNYIYNGIINQITGSGLPTTCNDLTIANTAANGTVSFNTVPTTQIVNGINLLQSGTFIPGANSRVRIVGTGTLNSTGGFMKANDCTVEMAGTSGTAQSLRGSWFVNRNISTLIDNNTTGITVNAAANDTLLISSALLYGSSITNSMITTNNNLTLLSRDTATARFGEIVTGSNNNITGNVNVERYVSTLRKWRHLAVNTTSTQTARQSWMENNATANGNLVPGYGTIITDDQNTWSANGFDSKSVSGPSLKFYNPSANTYSTIPNTHTYALGTQNSYYNFVRGDRSCTPANANVSTTILRTTGTLKKGPLAFNVLAGKFASIGNPYASAIDVRQLVLSNVSSDFYVWDPKLTGFYGLGAYQHIIKSGADFFVMPGGGSYGAVGSVVDTIESGQAFFAKSSGLAGTVTFNENAKTINKRTMSRTDEGKTVIEDETVFALMSLVDPGENTLVDGAMASFNVSVNSAVDFDDAPKMSNTSENVSFKRDGSLLAIERRGPVQSTDTLYLNMAGLRAHEYQWDISFVHMDVPGRTAFLIDNFLSSVTPLNLSTVNTIPFKVVNIPGAYAADRFKIVFTQVRVLPVRFTTISAARNTDKTVSVSYTTESEVTMQNYKVQHSSNGQTFTDIDTQLPTNNNGGGAVYTYTDANASDGDNYYRVRGNSQNGRIDYTSIVKVGPLKQNAGISIYPNPVTDGMVNVRFANMPKGAYELRVVNSLGQTVQSDSVKISTGNTVRSMPLPTGTPKGLYQMSMTDNEGKVTTISFIVW